MKTRTLLIATMLAAGTCAGVGATDFPTNRAVPDARLDRIRGGYDLGDQLRASFALERTVFINGMEAMRTTISVPDIAKMSAEQATALRDALRTTVITNGAGGAESAVPSVPAVAQTPPPTADTSTVTSVPAVAAPPVSAPTASTAPMQALPQAVVATLPSSGLAGLIVQNSLDNQAISATTTIDASVNTANMLQNMRVAESIQNAVIQYRGN